jgi:hypothetical protein
VTAQELWRAIESVPPPAPPRLPNFAAEELVEISREISFGERFAGFFKVAVPLAVVGILLATFVSTSAGFLFAALSLSLLLGNKVVNSEYDTPAPSSRLPRALRIEWQNAIERWRNNSSASRFDGALSELEQARRSLVILVEKQREELERLEQLHQPRQHKTFLDSFEIDKALFVSVSASHVEMLASHGIRSAGDLRRNRALINDLLPAAAEGELRFWETQCALTYKFDKRDPAYVLDAAKIEEKYLRQRKHFIEKLRRGPQLLTVKRDEVANARAQAEDILRRKSEYIRKRREEEKQ